MLEEVEEKGVIFLDTDTALKKHPELFKQYFGKLVPYTDNKFAALNSCVWSGGSFIYVPKGYIWINHYNLISVSIPKAWDSLKEH